MNTMATDHDEILRPLPMLQLVVKGPKDWLVPASARNRQFH